MLRYIALVILFTLYSGLASQGYTIEKYDIEIVISQDGYFDIQEEITVNFQEKRRGIFRKIPKNYKINGKTQGIVLSKVKVDNYNYKRLSEGNNNIIRIGSPKKYLTGKQIYKINYRIANAYLFATDHIAFQYNLISDWDTPIKELNYEIRLPDNLNLNNEDALIMTGAQGERNKHVSLNLDQQKISGRSLTSIPAKHKATIALRFPLGYVEEPVSPFSIKAAKREKGWLIPAILSLLTLGFYKSKSRKPDLGNIEDQYYPPADFSPPLVGAYYDHKVQTEDIISLLPYWANLGFVKILKGKEVLYFKKLKELPEDYPYYQVELFNQIFETDALVMLEDLNTKLGSQVKRMKGELHNQIVNRELFDEYNYKLFHKGAFLALGLVLIIAAIFSAGYFKNFFLVLSLGLFGLIALIIHGSRPKLSEKGVELKRQLLGLKQFLEKGDPAKVSQLVAEQPDYFQQMYPFAIAFGIDKTWTTTMDQMSIPPPSWYDNYDERSGYGFDRDASSVLARPSMGDFRKDFDIPEISSVFTSVPAPPAGSNSGGRGGGFSGGGGAGGGFGGGGGAW